MSKGQSHNVGRRKKTMTFEFILFYAYFAFIVAVITIGYSNVENEEFESPVMFIINVLGLIASVFIFDKTSGIKAWVLFFSFIIVLFALSFMLAKNKMSQENKIRSLLVLLALIVFLIVF